MDDRPSAAIMVVMNPAAALSRPDSAAPSARAASDLTAVAVGFRIRHLGIATVRGTFSDCSARVERVDGGLRIEGTVGVASVASGNDIRDNRLRGEFFEVDRSPHMVFTGTLADGADRLEGELTIRATTRPLSLRVTREALRDGSVRLVAEGELSRTAFDLDWGALREAGRLVVADRVKVRAEAVLAPDATRLRAT